MVVTQVPQFEAQDPIVSQTMLRDSVDLSAMLPRVLIAARKLAQSVSVGWHGRRRSGVGEDFWQYRPIQSFESASLIDWRRSARDHQHYVREREWQLSQTMMLWSSFGAGMHFGSQLSSTSKLERGFLMAVALADLFGQAEELVGYLEHFNPRRDHKIAERIVDVVGRDPKSDDLPDLTGLKRHGEAIIFSDFFGFEEELLTWLDQLSASGARAHLVQIVDPVEERFPFAGRVDFQDPDAALSVIADQAQSWRDDYQRALNKRRHLLETTCKQRRWSFFVHRTDQSASTQLLSLLARLEQGGGVATSFSQNLGGVHA